MRAFIFKTTAILFGVLSIFSAQPALAAVNYAVNPGTTVMIDEWGVCYNVTNNIPNDPIFVPTNTAGEWSSFYTNVPPNVQLAPCVGAVPGCTDPSATNYNPAATFDNGSCTYLPGCVPNAGDPCTSAPNSCGQVGSGVIQCLGTCSAVTPPEASCPVSVPGCTDPSATNYNPAATVNNGSCTYLPGCVPTAGDPCTSAPNSCGQTNPGVIQCSGTCSAVTPSNGGCVGIVLGCTDPSATNYNPAATVDNGSCTYLPGCVPTAGDSCVSGANICGQTNLGVIQCSGVCSAVTPPDTSCPVTVLGCTDPSATNYNPAASFDDGSCTYAPVCVPNVGTACTSAANACGQTGAGTIQCDGSCSAVIPATPPNLGDSCASGANNCGDTNVGSIQCNGSCSAVVPVDRGSCAVCPNAGQACASAANACGQTSVGTIDAGTCTCNANPPSVPSNLGDACTSAANACGQINAGTIQCNGSCSASVPSLPVNYGNPCTSPANACGYTAAGNIQCDGSCSATMPSLPVNYGNACTSAANNCGGTNAGTIQCDNSCSAVAPADVPGVGGACSSAPNNCGDRGAGTLQCNGTCSGSTPADVPGIGGACTSAANNCGDTSAGTVQCTGCDAVKPADRVCGPGPDVPGCTNPTAPNYDPGATVDDGSCDVLGCTDPFASNYDSNATLDDGSCNYDVYGCTDPNADSGYNPLATVDDGSCYYAPYVEIGCDGNEVVRLENGTEVGRGDCTPMTCNNGTCESTPESDCIIAGGQWMFGMCAMPCEPSDQQCLCNDAGGSWVNGPNGDYCSTCGGDAECECVTDQGNEWDGSRCCETIDQNYGFCL